jgi:hypothetical protein
VHKLVCFFLSQCALAKHQSSVHGIGQSASSGARTIGPALGGFLYGVGLENGCVGAVFVSTDFCVFKSEHNPSSTQEA